MLKNKTTNGKTTKSHLEIKIQRRAENDYPVKTVWKMSI